MNEDIFPYHNGLQPLYGDPLAIDLALRETLGCDPNEIQALTQSKNPAESVPATRKLLAAVRKAFSLAPFNPQIGEGCTDRATCDVWNQYADFCAKKNVSTESSQGSLLPDFVQFPPPVSNLTPTSASASG